MSKGYTRLDLGFLWSFMHWFLYNYTYFHQRQILLVSVNVFCWFAFLLNMYLIGMACSCRIQSEKRSEWARWGKRLRLLHLWCSISFVISALLIYIKVLHHQSYLYISFFYSITCTRKRTTLGTIYFTLISAKCLLWALFSTR